MATTGIIARRGLKDNLRNTTTNPGEILYATDTGEHGWRDANGDLVWKRLSELEPIKVVVDAPTGDEYDQIGTVYLLVDGDT